jgi:hypothetical protein
VPPEEREALIEIILATVSDEADLTTPGTPQQKASEWLIDLDPAYTCPGDDGLVQRYTMAVFYYSTEGDDWDRCSAPSNFTDPAIVAAANENCGLLGDAWLTGDECTWGGVSCENGEIVRFDFRKCLVLLSFLHLLSRQYIV